MLTAWSICRARSSPRRSGGISARRQACRASCRPGRSCASVAPHSRPLRSKTPCGRVRSRTGKICFSRATGLIRGCRRQLRGRYGRETAPPVLSSPCGRREGCPVLIETGRLIVEISGQMHSGSNSVGVETSGALAHSIASATRGLLEYRRPDGHWVFELEADCTIPAEYVLLRHYVGEPVD